MHTDDLPSTDNAESEKSGSLLDFPVWIIGNVTVAVEKGFPRAAYRSAHRDHGLFLPVFRDVNLAKLFIERLILVDHIPVRIDSGRWMKLLAWLKTEGATCVAIDPQAEPDGKTLFVGLDWLRAHQPTRTDKN
jgi:hypothetical protein